MRVIIVVSALLLLSGCESLFGSYEVPEPVGIGRSNDDLKRSPCACLEVPQQWGDWQIGHQKQGEGIRHG
jgi:hypothetical protein